MNRPVKLLWLLSILAPPVVFGQALSTTVGVSSHETGSFSSGLTQPNLFQIGSETPSTIWGATGFTDGITSIVDVPDTSTIYQSNAVNGFIDNYSSSTAGVAGYFTARCSANGTQCWGINPQVTDRNDQGTLTGIIMSAAEFDVDVVNTGTQVSGVRVQSDFLAQPESSWAYRVSGTPTKSGTYPWTSGFVTDDGAINPNGSGLSLGATGITGPAYSQILGLVGINGSGVHKLAYLQGTSNGGLNFASTAGQPFAFYNGPVALNTLAASTSMNACLNSTTYSGLYVIAACTSLREYKDHIAGLAPSLGEVMRLKPVAYDSKTSGNREVGFVAEQVQQVDKRLSSYDRGKLIGVQYDHMVALLTKAVQEQQEEIVALRRELVAMRDARRPANLQTVYSAPSAPVVH